MLQGKVCIPRPSSCFLLKFFKSFYWCRCRGKWVLKKNCFKIQTQAMLEKNRYQYNIKYPFKNYCQDINCFSDICRTDFNIFCLIKKFGHFFLISEKIVPSSRIIIVLIVATKCNLLTFCLHPKGQPEGIRSSNTYTLTDVRRNATGDYKCSLIDQKSMIASTAITVHCKSPPQDLLHLKGI